MSTVNPRLVYWIACLYDDPDLTAADRDVLTYLGVKRLDFGTGAGYCSIETLAKGTDWSESTVKRALARGQKKSRIERTRRGNRSGDGSLVASEWQVLYPASTGHGRPVEASVGVTGDPSSVLYRSQTASLQVTPEPPTGSESSTVDDDARVAAAAALAEKYDWPLDHCERVVDAVVAKSTEPVRDPMRYVVIVSVPKNPASWAPDAPRWQPKDGTGQSAGKRSSKKSGSRPPASSFRDLCKRCYQPGHDAEHCPTLDPDRS